MAKQFAGFTEQQKEVLARRMGFSGPMYKFGEFLQSDPAKAQKFSLYEQKARDVVTGMPIQQAFAGGGEVADTATKDPKPSPTDDINAIATAVSNSEGSKTTQGMIDNPQDYITPVETTPLTVSQNELINTNSGQLGAINPASVKTVNNVSTVANPTETQAHTVTTTETNPDVTAATQNMQAAHGTVSDQSQVEAATALPSSDATVAGQLTKLMSQFDGTEPPAWAAGAMRNAQAIMAQRGMGASTMAAGAVTQAAMESTIAIAAQDASTFSQFEMANLNNRQQARLVNAQSFLQMDMANLNNDQQMDMFKSQSIIQSLFTDAAADNASKQFNATSQNQTDQFFASLKTQVQTFNAAQKNTIKQFNAGETNSMTQFNKQMEDSRQKFNAQNRLIIDQSNAEWRRSVATANNATINDANKINAQAATNMTLSAYNDMMQRERDLYSFAFSATENAKDRAVTLATAQMASKASSKAGLGEALGKLLGTVTSNIFDHLWG